MDEASSRVPQEWLADVKAMMASGKEDGLAMALAQNMMESREKDKTIAALQRQLARLPPSERPAAEPPAASERERGSAQQPAKGMPCRPTSGLAARPRVPSAARGGAAPGGARGFGGGAGGR